MASGLAVLLLLSACFFTVTVGGDDCQGYFGSNGMYIFSITCESYQHCCGTCDNRYCCSNPFNYLTESDQNFCFFSKSSGVAIGLTVGGVVVLIIMFIVCCCCPCCCIYQMCRKPRPVVGTHVTTVTNMQCVQQQGGQYPQYQPVPTQQGYGGQPMQTGPYQGQQYAPGPPPPYHMATSPGYPTSQSAYAGGQAMYPTQPSAQPSVAYVPSETSNQPAYNPAYMQPPKTGY